MFTARRPWVLMTIGRASSSGYLLRIAYHPPPPPRRVVTTIKFPPTITSPFGAMVARPTLDVDRSSCTLSTVDAGIMCRYESSMDGPPSTNTVGVAPRDWSHSGRSRRSASMSVPCCAIPANSCAVTITLAEALPVASSSFTARATQPPTNPPTPSTTIVRVTKDIESFERRLDWRRGGKPLSSRGSSRTAALSGSWPFSGTGPLLNGRDRK